MYFLRKHTALITYNHEGGLWFLVRLTWAAAVHMSVLRSCVAGHQPVAWPVAMLGLLLFFVATESTYWLAAGAAHKRGAF